MITVKHFEEFLNDFCSPELAFDRDNVGLLVGDSEKLVKKVLITLDVDEVIAQEAVDKGANLIISHHPLMFHPIKHLTVSEPMQRTLIKLIKNDISLISAHTNLDCVKGGLNDYLAEKLNIENACVIEVVSESNGIKHGFGRIGELPAEISLSQMLELCSCNLKTNSLKFVGNPDRKIKKVAVNCGGGADALDECIRLGADLFITGDVKYNQARTAYENGIALIDAGHYETEHIVTELFYEKLSGAFPEILFEISQTNVLVFGFYHK